MKMLRRTLQLNWIRPMPLTSHTTATKRAASASSSTSQGNATRLSCARSTAFQKPCWVTRQSANLSGTAGAMSSLLTATGHLSRLSSTTIRVGAGYAGLLKFQRTFSSRNLNSMRLVRIPSKNIRRMKAS